jgi:hypothetical protein
MRPTRAAPAPVFLGGGGSKPAEVRAPPERVALTCRGADFSGSDTSGVAGAAAFGTGDLPTRRVALYGGPLTEASTPYLSLYLHTFAAEIEDRNFDGPDPQVVARTPPG